jgi:hypothetical protein
MRDPDGYKYTFPPAYAPNGERALLCVPVSFIPFFHRFFDDMQEESRWKTREDWYKAYQVFADMEAELMSGCLRELIESNRQIYRLLSTVYLGTEYTVTPAETPVPALPADPTRPTITPAIPDAPPATLPALLPLRALLNRQLRLVDLVDNALNGTIIDSAPSLQPSVRDNLEAIRILLQTANTDDIAIEDILQIIALAVA